MLAEEGFVHLVDGQWQWTQESYPADAVSLRSVTSDNFVVVDMTRGERVIGETDFTSGPSTLHEKAIYIVEGQLFQVERFDFDNRKAFVREVECDYYTDAITYTKVTILETFAGSGSSGAGPSTDDVAALAAGIEAGSRRQAPGPTSHRAAAPLALGPGPSASHGEVHVVSRVVGFKKIKFYTNENVGSGELDLPEQQMHTTSYWLTIPAETDGGAAVRHGRSARRRARPGVRDAQRRAAAADVRRPRSRAVDRRPVGRRRVTPRRREPRVASGRSCPPRRRSSSTTTIRAASASASRSSACTTQLLARTRELIDGCPCESGCPSCVGPEGATGPLAKAVALAPAASC